MATSSPGAPVVTATSSPAKSSTSCPNGNLNLPNRPCSMHCMTRVLDTQEQTLRPLSDWRLITVGRNGKMRRITSLFIMLAVLMGLTIGFQSTIYAQDDQATL